MSCLHVAEWEYSLAVTWTRMDLNVTLLPSQWASTQHMTCTVGPGSPSSFCGRYSVFAPYLNMQWTRKKNGDDPGLNPCLQSIKLVDGFEHDSHIYCALKVGLMVNRLLSMVLEMQTWFLFHLKQFSDFINNSVKINIEFFSAVKYFYPKMFNLLSPECGPGCLGLHGSIAELPCRSSMKCHKPLCSMIHAWCSCQ